MNFAAILSLLSTAWTIVSPLVTLADQAATASGNEKLEFVTGAIVKAHAAVVGVEQDVSGALPLLTKLVSDFADLKHAGKAVVAEVKNDAAGIAAGAEVLTHAATA